MKTRRFLMTLSLAMMSMMMMASKVSDVEGTVLDDNGEPMEYVNVVLLSATDSTYIQGAVTNENGAFMLKTTATQGILKLSSVGYETKYIPFSSNTANTTGMVVRMEDNAQTLDAVVVKSTMPKTRVSGDAMRTTVAGSILEKAGTATDVLNKIPSLSAEKDGGVTVFGRGDAEIYINGRRVQDPKELSRLTSEQVQSVDVIHNPGARYSASTKAVVRIQLRKAQGEGFSFQDYATGVYQYGFTETNSLEANYRTGGLDVTAELWAGRYGHAKSLQQNDITFYNGPEKMYSHSGQNSKNLWKGWSPQVQINYMFNENHSIGAFYKYDRHPGEMHKAMFVTDVYADGAFTEHSESDIRKGGSYRKHIFNAYYNGKVGKLGIDLNIDGLFDKTDDPNSTDEVTRKADGQKTHTFVSNDTRSTNDLFASKLILTYPVWNGNLSVGGEYSYTDRNDAYTFESEQTLPVKATDTNIKENVASAFAEYGHAFGRLYAQLGLRYEYLNNEYYSFGIKDSEVSRKYGDWFPTAMLSMPVGKAQMSLAYRRDISRPAYSNLSSSTMYINRYTYQSGNPYLRPQYSHSVVFNAAYKSFNLTVNFSRTKDEFTMITENYPGSNDPLVSLIHAANGSDGYNQLMINPSYRPTIGLWHPMWSAGVIVQNYKTLCAEGTMKKLNHPFGQFVWNNDFEFRGGFRVNAQLQYSTRGDMGNFRLTKDRFLSQFGVQKDFSLKRLGSLTVNASVFDAFNTNRTSATIYSIREVTSYNPGRRTFELDLKWRYNEARSKYRGSGAGDKQKSRM